MKTILSALAIVLGLSANAVSTNTVKDCVSDWTLPSSYEEGTVPGAGDVVIVPSNATVTVTAGSASFALVSSLANIVPTYDSTVVVDVPDAADDVTLDCSFSCLGRKVRNSDLGTIVKRGPGILRFSAMRRYMNGTSSSWDFYDNITVEAGTLYFPTNYPAKTFIYCGALSVSNSATVFTPLRKSGVASAYDAGTLHTERLYGGGLVTNLDINSYILLGPDLCGRPDGEFSGCLANQYIYQYGSRTFLSGSSVFTRPIVLADMAAAAAVIGVRHFGKTDGKPSSIGTSKGIYLREQGSTLKYIGDEDETCDKTFQFWQRYSKGLNRPVTIDGGDHGGLTFNGTFKYNTDYPKQSGLMNNLVLTGPNAANPCVIDAAFDDTMELNGTNYAVYVTKKGAGTWRMTNHANRKFSGGVAVEEGTLEYCSLAEAGKVCSLGLATILQDGTVGLRDPSHDVDYAIALGSTSAAPAAPAVFAFAGSTLTGAVCSTRPIVLKGDAHVRNVNPKAAIHLLSGVRSLDVGADGKTLVLDGDGEYPNEISDITDGDGVTSVRKEGTGTWELSGELSFGGRLDVREGEVVVLSPGENYTWFRWTIQENIGISIYTNGLGEICTQNVTQFQIEDFGLFDEDGRRVNVELSLCSNYFGLASGEVAHGRLDPLYDYYDESKGYARSPDHLCDNVRGLGGYSAIAKKNGGTVRATEGNPESWIPVVMRLADGSAAVKGYDFVNMYQGTTNGWNNPKMQGANIAAWKLEGSVDGRTWDLLDTYRTNALAYPATYRWLFEQTTFPQGGDTTAHTKFRRIKQSGPTVPAPKVNRLGNATVSVASGARLRAEGDVTISKLEVDANGAGTIDGFAFAESGKLVVDNLPDRTAVALPGSYPNAKGFGNLSKWTLESADGKRLNSKIVVQDGEIMIVPNGLLIIVR